MSFIERNFQCPRTCGVARLAELINKPLSPQVPGHLQSSINFYIYIYLYRYVEGRKDWKKRTVPLFRCPGRTGNLRGERLVSRPWTSEGRGFLFIKSLHAEHLYVKSWGPKSASSFLGLFEVRCQGDGVNQRTSNNVL